MIQDKKLRQKLSRTPRLRRNCCFRAYGDITIRFSVPDFLEESSNLAAIRTQLSSVAIFSVIVVLFTINDHPQSGEIYK